MNDQTTIEDLYGNYTPPSGGGNFFSLDDDETKRVRIYSEPYAYRATFKAKEADKPDQVSTRYAWLAWNHDEKKAQIIKQSATFYSTLAALVKNPDWGNPAEYDVSITRTGTGTDSKYAIIGARKSLELDERALKALAAVDLVTDSKEDMIVPLRQYIAAGKKFPDEVNADGSPAVKDL